MSTNTSPAPAKQKPNMDIKANRDFWNKLQRICAEHGPWNGNPNSRAPHAVEIMEQFLEMLRKG